MCLAGAAITLGLLLGPAAVPAGATFAGSNGRILYERTAFGNPDRTLWTVLPFGTGPRRILAPSTMSGTGEYQISPGGGVLLFSQVVNWRRSIFTMRMDGTLRTRRTFPPENANDRRPTLSPTGPWFYQRDPQVGGVSIYRFGSSTRIMASAEDLDSTGQPAWIDGPSSTSSMSVSPDGTMLVAVRSRTVASSTPGSPPTSHSEELWVVGTNGQGARRLTQWGDLSGRSFMFPEVRWSKAGIIYFTAVARGDTSSNPVFNLYRINPSGTGVAFLAGNVSTFDVSPNGSFVTFRNGSTGQVVRLGRYGGSRVTLTSLAFSAAGDPRFSPSSGRIAVTAYRPSNNSLNRTQSEIYTMRVDGTDKRRVTSTLGINEYLADWQAL